MQKNYQPYQKYSVLGENAIIRIAFDHELLARSYNFSGSLSLEAKSGDKKIQVNPYFTTGQGQSFYGVNSVPTLDVADYIVKLVFDVKQGRRLISQISKERGDKLRIYKALQGGIAKVKGEINNTETRFDYSSEQRTQQYAIKIINEIIIEVDFIRENSTEKNEYLEVENASPLLIGKIGVLQALVIEDVFDKIFNYEDNALTYDEVGRYLNDLISEINGDERVLRRSSLKVFPSIRYQRSHNDFNKLINTLSRLSLYVKHIASQNTDVQTAFLKLLGLNITEFNEVEKKIIAAHEDFTKMSVNDWSSLYSYNRDSSIIRHKGVNTKLNGLSNTLASLLAPGSQLTRELQNLGYNDDFMLVPWRRSNVQFRDNDSLLTYDFLDALQTSPLSILNSGSLGIKSDYEELIESLAFKAGLEIYQRLVMATIKVEEARLKDGDELEVDVVWYRDGNYNAKDDDLNNRQVLTTATFHIKKIGWHMNVSESAVLVKRIDEEFLPDDYPLARSNFKPTAGAALMWSYHNTFRGWQNFQKHEFHTGTRFGNFLRWFEPSFGLNVTYLDFDNTQTFEVGFGPMIGLWRNKLFFTGGYNLMVEGQSPYYLAVGFSFSNVAETVGKFIEQDPSKP